MRTWGRGVLKPQSKRSAVRKKDIPPIPQIVVRDRALHIAENELTHTKSHSEREQSDELNRSCDSLLFLWYKRKKIRLRWKSSENRPHIDDDDMFYD
jgi:hypothetical protein